MKLPPLPPSDWANHTSARGRLMLAICDWADAFMGDEAGAAGDILDARLDELLVEYATQAVEAERAMVAAVAAEAGQREREAIIRAAVAAMPATNPLIADDLIEGFTMHTEADDIVAIWEAARATQPAQPLSEEQIERGYRGHEWSSVPHPFRGSVGFERGVRFAERHHGIQPAGNGKADTSE